MARIISNDSIRHYVRTGQFNVVKLENDESISLLNSYPSSWHNHIKQLCTDMINELMLKVKVTAIIFLDQKDMLCITTLLR